MKYSDLLKDPRWQKKRLEIFELDRWTCRHCRSKERTLNVHHIQYTVGKKPWEYENDKLITLCEICHKEAHTTNWQQAFLDLNTSPQELVDIALTLQHYFKVCAEKTAPLQEKYKCRSHLEDFSIVVDLSNGETRQQCMDALDAFHAYFKNNRHKYGCI